MPTCEGAQPCALRLGIEYALMGTLYRCNGINSKYAIEARWSKHW